MAGSKRQENNWAELPKDLLGLILQKLILQDHVRFSCVCAYWNLAVKERIGCPKPQAPWLMHAGGNSNDEDDAASAQFFSLSEKRSYSIPLPLPEIKRRLCVGSCHGWLITAYDMSEMHLLNPVTRVQIQLPSIKTLPYFRRFKKFPLFLLHKAILSSPPRSDGSGDFMVILLHRPAWNVPDLGYTLATVRVGESSWTPLRAPRMVDIIQYKGQQLCGIDTSNILHFWDRHGYPSEPKSKSKSKLRTCELYDKNLHLVESVTGELILLKGALVLPRLEDLSIKARRLDLEGRRRISVRGLKSLNVNAIFVGKSHSFAVSATEFPELRRNHIYFTDDYYHNPMKCVHRQRMMGTLDMKRKRVKPFRTSYLNWPPPIWVTPNML